MLKGAIINRRLGIQLYTPSLLAHNPFTNYRSAPQCCHFMPIQATLNRFLEVEWQHCVIFKFMRQTGAISTLYGIWDTNVYPPGSLWDRKVPAF